MVTAVDRAVADRAEPVEVLFRSLVLLDALLLAIAAGVHGTLAPEHARESVLLGLGFSLTAAVQLICGLLLLFRPSRTLLRGVVVLGVLAIVVWAASRIVGLPVGPEAGSPEHVGLVDLGTVAVELVSVLLSAGLAAGRLTNGGTRMLASIRTALMVVGGFGLFLLVEAQSHAAEGDAAAHQAAHLLLAAVIAGAFALVFGVRWLLRRSTGRLQAPSGA